MLIQYSGDCRLLKIDCLGIPVSDTPGIPEYSSSGLKFKRKLLQVVAGSPMAELHIVGSLVGAKDFEESSLFCKWQLITDDGRPDNKR